MYGGGAGASYFGRLVEPSPTTSVGREGPRYMCAAPTNALFAGVCMPVVRLENDCCE